jgi:hypothetical protein
MAAGQPRRLLNFDVRHLMGSRDWITAAAKALGFESTLKLVEPHRFQGILELLVTERTHLGRGGITALWWWESLREPVASRVVQDPIATVQALVDPAEPIWFVAEASDQKRIGNFWLYETTIDPLCAVLRECPMFEFYVASREMDWILCENHHGYVIAGGEPMASRLSNA